MSLGLNTLKGEATSGIGVGSFIKDIKDTAKADAKAAMRNNSIIKQTNIGLKMNPISSLKKDIMSVKNVTSSVHNLMHAPNIGNTVNHALTCLAENPPSLEDLKEGAEGLVTGIKDEATVLATGVKAMVQNAADEAVSMYKGAKQELKDDYQKVSNLANIDITAKDVGKFVEGMGEALAVAGTALLLHRLNKLSDKYNNCDSVPNNLITHNSKHNSPSSSSVTNALTQAALSQGVKGMDCSGGNGMGALTNMANGGCGSSGVGVSSAAKVMKLSSNAINVNTGSLVNITHNDKVKGLVTKTFNPAKTINKVLNNNDGNDHHDTGGTIVNVFGSGSITHLKKETKNKRNMSRTHKRRREHAYINGIVAAAKVAL